MLTSARQLLAAFTLLALAAVDTRLALAEGSEMPTFSGKGTITQAIDTDTGAVFDLGGGVTMLFPKGLPVGHSRLITLKKSTKKPSAAQVHKGFVALGSALDLNVPLNAPSKPIVVAMSSKNDPRKHGSKLVLAMEIGTLCTAENKAWKLSNGLCSGWELTDARYDDNDKRVIAELRSTGGMRMVFGLVPDEE